MALSGVGAARTPTDYIAGPVTSQVLERKTSHLPVYDIGGAKYETASLSEVVAANDSGYIELPAWESAQLRTGDLRIDVASLNTDLFPSLYVSAGNAYGSIGGMALTYLFVSGNANISGSIDGMALTYLVVAGNANISGSIDGMALTFLLVANNANISGSIDGMALTYLFVSGNANISGSIDGMALTYLYVANNANIYLSTIPSFQPSTRRIFFNEGLTQSMVDFLLEGASLVTTWTSEKDVSIIGSTPAPSAAGLAFIPTITAAGATVQHN